MKSRTTTARTPRSHGRTFRLAGLASLVLLLTACGDRHLSTMDPESPIAERLDSTLVNLLWACLVVLVLVMGTTIYMAYRFRVKASRQRR